MKNEHQYFPRTLIISANSLSTQTNNGKMVASFFKSYPPENVAQVYTWPEYPDSSLCSSYYRITDQEMMFSWLGRIPGQRVKCCSVQRDVSQPTIFRKRIKNWPVLRLVRDIIWLNPHWKNPDFMRWLDKFAPEVVLFLGLNNPTMYRMAEWVADRFNASVIVYITDDYFLPRRSFSLAYQIRRKWLESSMRRLLHREHTELLTVNRYMTEMYRNFFGKEGKEIFNAVSVPENVKVKRNPEGPLCVSYIGNLANNRTSTLQEFCKILIDYPNKELFRFQIFTREEFSDKQLQKLTLPPYVCHCGALDADGVALQLKKSDVLMHMESFGYNNRRDTLLSLSTKLMEYLAAARPILMIGPPEIGSTRFLRENTPNLVADTLSRKCIYATLDRLLDNQLREKISLENFAIIREIQQKNANHSLLQTVSNTLLKKES